MVKATTQESRPVPNDLASALAHAGLTEFFSGCTPAHKREYLKWIEEAKRPETRQSRIEHSIVMLAQRRSKEVAARPSAQAVPNARNV